MTIVKRLWNDPVWSKVIAGVILAAGATIGAYFLNWWPIIGRFTRSGYNFILFTTSVPNWLLVILGIVCLPTIFLVLSLIWEKTHIKNKDTEADWRSYKTDIYFGLRWRWKYFQGGAIHDVNTFCPLCDFQVFPYNASAYSIIDRIGYHCDSCGSDLGQLDESQGSLENKVIRLIQQKLRNGSWQRTNRQDLKT